MLTATIGWLLCWAISWASFGFIATGNRKPFETHPKRVPYSEQIGMHAIQFAIAPLLVLLSVVTLGQNIAASDRSSS